MTDEILEAEQCPVCGADRRPPLDGRWRWARGGKVFGTAEAAINRAASLEKQGRQPYEYRGAVDAEGQARIATRRTA